MKNKIKVLILTGYGLNCDNETAYACELAGAEPSCVHINLLINKTVSLDNYKMLVFGGGFSWGDDHGGGVVQSVRLKTHVGEQILKFIEKGNLILGICNGFQTIVNMGLLPGINADYKKRTVALTYNDSGNFRDHWVNMAVNDKSPCVFTKNIKNIELPIRHGEGKFYTDDNTLKEIIKNEQVVLRYADKNGSFANGKFPTNPNGALYDIAGICDSTGKIFGLMPHPEAYNHFTNHPDWTRVKHWSTSQEPV